MSGLTPRGQFDDLGLDSLELVVEFPSMVGHGKA